MIAARTLATQPSVMAGALAVATNPTHCFHADGIPC
jgi:hypothetical protein